MTRNRILAAVVGGVIFAAAGVAVASNFLSSAQTADFYAPGKHQFYVWCAGSSDYVATAHGANAEDAQMKLYDAAKAIGRSACWPVWQGRIGS